MLLSCKPTLLYQINPVRALPSPFLTDTVLLLFAGTSSVNARRILVELSSDSSTAPSLPAQYSRLRLLWILLRPLQISKIHKSGGRYIRSSMGIEFHLLQTITSNFSDDQKVGSGEYGDVYKGVYNGKEIAVKRLRTLQGFDDKAFDIELRNLSRIKHKNVVQLLGYCYQSVYVPNNEEMERILCFEYVEGGGLDKHIGDEYCTLDWQTCYQIIRGTCDGLNHLHGAHEKPIFHLDLKPSNILLDKNMTAQIADLGLSRIVASTKTQIVDVKGSLGYMPPEYIHGGYISNKYDVFSLGVIILKIMTGNKGHSRYFEMSREQFTKDVIETWDGRLQETLGYSSHEKDILKVKKCIEIALKCVEKVRDERPHIKDIVHELGELEAKIKEMLLFSDMSRDIISQRGSKLSMPLQYLKDVTNNFCDERILGKGSFGVVFKGLLHNGEIVAVKKLHAIPSSQKQFENEVNLLMKLKHQNIVQLVGYCYETHHIHFGSHEGKPLFVLSTECLLCLECLPNGSLEKYISDASSGLSWHTRNKVIEGISYGLQYLHQNSNEPIIHLDLKPTNILLDTNMLPKITDFGLSRLFDQNQTIHTTTTRGTLGYMPPEFQRGIITPMSDIFSLGVIIMELITGHRDYPYDIGESSNRFIELELGKWRNRLQKEPEYGSLETNCQQIERCIQIGLMCVNPERTKRPTVKKIIDMLEGSENMNWYISNETSLYLYDDMLRIKPLELWFLLEPNKQISCLVELTNETRNSIAFNILTPSRQYSTCPDKGIVLPGCKRGVMTTLQTHESVTQFTNHGKFVVQSTKVKEGLEDEDITDHMFENNKVVDEVDLMVVCELLSPRARRYWKPAP